MKTLVEIPCCVGQNNGVPIYKPIYVEVESEEKK